MKTKTLIIGGGLTGLSLAYLLQNAGHDYQLIEARDRFGGRITSLDVSGAAVDLGPSWIWQGQTRIAALLDDLALEVFEQWHSGDQLFEHASGEIVKNAGFMSMAGSYRISGGTAALTDALVAKLDPARLHLGAAATRIARGAHVTCRDGRSFAADRIALCIPPRIAGAMTFLPPLPDDAAQSLMMVPTWMGAHAKFVAAYERPFWRDDNLSGDASSRRGPLVEIHDATPATGAMGALFGFVGIPADGRAELGELAVVGAAIGQLVALFGPEAGKPVATKLKDWSAEPFTATAADAVAPHGHPPYQMMAPLFGIWDRQLVFAVTELSADSGGLIEGALAASYDAAKEILAG